MGRSKPNTAQGVAAGQALRGLKRQCRRCSLQKGVSFGAGIPVGASWLRQKRAPAVECLPGPHHRGLSVNPKSIRTLFE